MKKHISLISIFTILFVTGCSALSSAEKKADYPQQPDDIRRNRAGSLIGNGGFKIFSGFKDSGEHAGDASGNAAIGVNGYLWRASLDTLSFMPLVSADPLGGVIITDWYEAPEAKGERFKVNLIILERNLRSNSVKITVFKQNLKSGSWQNSSVSDKVERDLENKVLTRAREIRVEKESR